MSIPSRLEAAAIVSGLEPNERLLRHSTAVAEVAAFLCAAMARRGVAVDCSLVEAAALLHDLDKALPEDEPLRALGHGHAGAEWLRRRGLSELAKAVACHPVMEMGSAESFEAWAVRAGLEGQVVTYADKRARQDLLTLDERFAKWHANYPDSPKLDLAHERARRLEREMCELAGLRPENVQRLNWVAEATRAAA
jgi:putative nucleotidyltransferase with HDIG domain